MSIPRTIRLAIVSLLLSLVLSGGEGISLLPVAAAAGLAPEKSSAPLTSSTTHRYEYAARFFGSPLKHFKPAGTKARDGGIAVAGLGASDLFQVRPGGAFRSRNFGWTAFGEQSGVPAQNRTRGPPTSC